MRKRKWLILIKADHEGNVKEKMLHYSREGWSGTPNKAAPKVGNSVVWYEPTRWWKHRDFRNQVLWDPLLSPWSWFKSQSISIRLVIIGIIASSMTAIVVAWLTRCPCP